MAHQLEVGPEHALAVGGMFADLPVDDRRAVAEAGTLLHVEGGTVVVEEGAPGDELYVLLSGEACVLVDLEGERVEVGRLHAGDTFGDLAVLLDQPRLATVLATGPAALLRLDRAALDVVVHAHPRVGVALARDLARRLQVALGESTDLRLQAEPDKVVVPPQDLARMRGYMARYYAVAVRNVAKRHRLLTGGPLPRYETRFTLAAQEQQRWFGLFDVAPDEPPPPFTYYTTSGTMLLMRIVEDVGVNFRHLLHLRSAMTFAAGGPGVVPGREHRLTAAPTAVVPMGGDKAVVVIETRVEDPDGAVVQLGEDAFVIRNVEESVLASLPPSGDGRAGHLDLDGVSRRAPVLAAGDGVRTVPIDVPDDMGMRYGKVSGDLNMVHTTRTAARVFGHPRPFVQGLCTANLVLRHLTSAAPAPLAELDVTFARRVFVGQTVHLRHDDARFEVVDGDERLLAFGGWRSAVTRRAGPG